MKNKLMVFLVLLSFGTNTFSAELNPVVINDTGPVEERVVELHVTFAPPPTLEAKKSRKTMYMKSGRAVCSGSFVTSFGHVLTAKHCVEGATEIDVITYDNKVYKAEIRGQSAIADLALIQIGRFNTPYFKLADSLKQSEAITIIGSPLGLSYTKTSGTVGKIMGDIVIFDCTAVPGNSGGPVLNSKNEIVGVVSAMVIVFLGPARLTVAQSVDSIKFFGYTLAGGK